MTYESKPVYRMKYFPLLLLLSLTILSPIVAQRNWEMGLVVRAGTYTQASDQTELLYDTYFQRERISAGLSTSLGGYAQRRIARGLALSAGLTYSLNQYEMQREVKESVTPTDQTWSLDATEHTVLAPVQVHFNVSRWSISTGPTLSYHLKTSIQSSHSDQFPVVQPITVLWCGTGLNVGPAFSYNFQWFWTGALEYNLSRSTRLGISTLMSFKKNDPMYSYSYATPVKHWESKSRLSIFPRSLALSLRHNLLK